MLTVVLSMIVSIHLHVHDGTMAHLNTPTALRKSMLVFCVSQLNDDAYTVLPLANIYLVRPNKLTSSYGLSRKSS